MDDRPADDSTSSAAANVGNAPRAGREAAKSHKDHVPRGILCMVAATMLFSLAFAFSKWQVAIYPFGEVVFLRSLSALIVVAVVMLPVTGFSVFATKRPRDHIARGLSQATSQTLSVLAFSLMPLAGAVAINFSAPLFAALVSIAWLKERAGPARWTALLVGFFGVLIVTHPGANSLTLGALFALGNAVLYGSVTVAVRGMTKTESANTLLIWQMVTIAFFHSFLLAFGWRTPTSLDALMLLGSGFANAAGQYFWTQALRFAPATAVSPFYYLMLVWALILGFIIWGDVPTPGLLAGSVIVVASGLFLLWREGRLHRAITVAATPSTQVGIAPSTAGGAVRGSVSTGAGSQRPEQQRYGEFGVEFQRRWVRMPGSALRSIPE